MCSFLGHPVQPWLSNHVDNYGSNTMVELWLYRGYYDRYVFTDQI